MYKISVNQQQDIAVERQSDGFLVNGEIENCEITPLGNQKYLIIKDHQVYNIDIIEILAEEKMVRMKINEKVVELKIKDKLDLLLEKLGIDHQVAKIVKDIKAPMPGLILQVNATEGAEVKKGDPLLILEAMKMENIIKSPTDGLISKIMVKKGESVEKNQILIRF